MAMIAKSLARMVGHLEDAAPAAKPIGREGVLGNAKASKESMLRNAVMVILIRQMDFIIGMAIECAKSVERLPIINPSQNTGRAM